MHGDWLQANSHAASFVAHSGNAAGHLAKAMLWRQGLDPGGSHNVARLADQAELGGHSELAEGVRRMDGFTQMNQVAACGSCDPASLCHAIQRLPVVIRRLERELSSATGHPKCAAQVRSLAADATELAIGAEGPLHMAILRNSESGEPPPPHGWLAPLAEACDIFVSELLDLGVELQPLATPEAQRNRGIGRSPFD